MSFNFKTQGKKKLELPDEIQENVRIKVLKMGTDRNNGKLKELQSQSTDRNDSSNMF